MRPNGVMNILAKAALGLTPLLAGCGLVRPTLRAAEVSEVPRPNKIIEMETLWSKARPLTVIARPPGVRTGPGLPVELRAIHDRRAISILARWPDPTESPEREEWIWSPQGRRYWHIQNPTDFFAIKFPLTGSREACMMTGEAGTSDVWMWRGGWTHITGIADDLRLIITPGAAGTPASGQTYPLSVKDGTVIHVQWQRDAGTPAYEPVQRPTEKKGARLRGIQARPGSGSAVDVLVEEVYQNNQWNLEFWRLLDTGHEDDYPIKGRGPHPLSIAVSNDREGSEHLTTDLFYLVLK